MEDKTYNKLVKLRDKKWFEAGGGNWWRNSDDLPCFVHVEFYPKTQAYIMEDWKFGTEYDSSKSHKITLKELEENYHRLRL